MANTGFLPLGATGCVSSSNQPLNDQSGAMMMFNPLGPDTTASLDEYTWDHRELIFNYY